MNTVSTSPRLDILDFARRMCAAGEVIVTTHTGQVERRVVVRDCDVDGFSVIGISAVDGVPSTCVMDFDFSDEDAMRHVVSADGESLLIRNRAGRVVVEYTIPSATRDLLSQLEAAEEEAEQQRIRAEAAEARLREIEENA